MRRRTATPGDAALYLVLAALAYLPVFLSRPGQVAADTKQYLYLDPGKLTTSAASMWDPNTGLGTVTHQNIGYLLPMGPYYWLVQWLGIPVWVGQRIWMGTVLLAAGAGAAYCARRLGLEGPGRAVAALAYMLTPYTLDYLDRTSAILMPWAALGWMIGLTATAARRGGWRQPARFALVVALVGGVNATSIVLVVAAPAIWLIHAVWVSREVTLRRAMATSARLAALCILVSVWWAAGLWAEGRYGINILRVTETVPTVSRTSSAAEVLRGLGYWYFYGWDKVQAWTLQSIPYTQSPWLLAVSLGLPGVSVLLGLLTRWVYRSYCLALVGFGTLIAVGAFPFRDPSAFGAVIKGASAGSELALAMRSVDRIVPIVVMGLAILMGSGVTALHLRRPGIGLAAAGTSLALIGANLPALWTGGLIASNLSRPDTIPSYWTAAASYLNSSGSNSRVLGLPGEDFGAYTWGVTEDPVPPGLLNRSYVSRQVVPAGTPASANLVEALDQPIQDGTLDFAALAPVARLMGVGQILLQSDLQYERYHLPFPQILYAEMTSPGTGLGSPTSFGAPQPAPQIRYPLDSETRLGLATDTTLPPALSVFNVSDPRPVVRTEPLASPVIVAGDGSGIVEAAGAGLLNGGQSILYAAAADHQPTEFADAMGNGATLVVTDTNPLANYVWGSMQANVGQVEQPGVADPADTPSDYALPVFPGQSTADQTVAVVNGVASAQATQYGDSLSFTPEFKPLNAFDGNPATAWAFGAHEPVSGVRLVADLVHPVTADHVTLDQLADIGTIKRKITSVTLLFDGGHPVTVALTAASLSAAGQTVSFPARTFDHFELVVNGATGGADKRYDGLPQVGFTGITIPGVGPASATLRMPTGLLATAGAASLSHPLDLLMNRQRVTSPPRQDPEPTMSRTFDLPTARSFSVGGTAEINAGDSDYLINQLVGLTPPSTATTGVTVTAANSSTRLDGDRNARANAAVDGDPNTAWIAETGPQSGEWFYVNLSRSVTFDHLDLQVLNDGRHSLPSRITISTPSGRETVSVPVPPVGAGRKQNSTTTIPLTFPALSGNSVRITIDAVRQVRALDYYSTYSGITDILPVGIAELGLPDVVQPAAPSDLPTVCTGGLLQIDGQPIDVEVTGTSTDALGGQQMAIAPCGNSAGGVELAAGSHTVTTSPRLPSGWSIDQVWLGSAAGGAPASGVAAAQAPAAPTPPVRIDHQDRTSLTVTVTGTGQPSWLVLGQSLSSGWKATVAGGGDLGPPQLIDGFANGWSLPAVAAGRAETIHLDWTPQKVIWTAIGVSAASIVGSVLLAVWPTGSRYPRRRRGGPAGSPPTPASWAQFAARRPPGWSAGIVVTVSAAVGWGIVASMVSRPVIGAAAGLFTLIGLRWRWGRLVTRTAAVAVLFGLAGYSVVQQVRYHYWPSIDWPGDLSSANDLAWMGLALLGADLVAGAVYARRRMQAAE
ncbi:MAG TPA: alpha-(1-_3)-arabinofuranosyltransferase family protein [Acidimicrobiales bacterium]|nr:alpha-(1->3)-arabinofuranosyltransferase family protein [Acidimicrobiales bacterium]